MISVQVKLHYPKPGYVEIPPDELLDGIVKVVRLATEGINFLTIDNQEIKKN